MPILRIGGITVDVDAAATRDAYAATTRGGAEECGCLECRNYAAARERVWTPEMRAFLDQFGIQCDRESEAVAMPADSEGERLYNGWFHFVGQIVASAQPTAKTKRTAPEVILGLSVMITDGRLPRLAAFGERMMIAMEFFVSVPWVLPEPPPRHGDA